MSSTVLIIDDTPSDIRALVELLRHQSFRIMVSLNGTDGFNKAILIQPDLILLDRLMPEMDGLHTCRLLKSDPRTECIPIIFLTAMQAVEDKVEGFKLGVCDYITKPWEDAEVIARLRMHIQLHQRFQAISPKPDSAYSLPDKPLSRQELRVYKAQNLYLQQIDGALTLTDVACSVGTHARQLAEDFRQVTGQSAQNWLRDKRMGDRRRILLSIVVPVPLNCRW